MQRRSYEVVIVGGGIAGASLAYFLTARGVRDVLLVEREAQPGYHSTGRSAAVAVEWDPIPALQALKAQGAAFLRQPPPDFATAPLLRASGILVLFQEPLWGAVRAVAPTVATGGTTVELLSTADVLARIPVLAPEYVDGGVLLPADGHIEVHELLWSYLRGAAQRGAERCCGVTVLGVRTAGGRVCGVSTNAGDVDAHWVVNAAGAWAGVVAAGAGASPIPITPCRRTIITFAVPDDVDASDWPLVEHESQHLYFAPEAGGMFASPMDEEPLAPCDAAPDELAIATAADRVARVAPRLAPRHVRRAWAGLRTFSPDRVLVVGEDPRLPGFFWLAGQGGCGIETSGAVGQIAADLLLDGRTERFDASLLTPGRFAA
ncbi:MAG TPA: FAD-binding oxidoreductase [Candidatus Dormibacteraeota bacterium]|nr:FAD-binding oxidoreductase [Candidatus Dormibacteraeota bacterium]